MTQRHVSAPQDTAAVGDVCRRIDAELKRRGKSWAWLSRELQHDSTARAANWKRRGVPRAEFPAIAQALGESADWVAGVAASKAEAGAAFSPMAARIARDFDQISSPGAQLDAFAKIAAIIAIARASDT